MTKIGVFGAGGWGTALAVSFSRAGNYVLLWSRSSDVCNTINNEHENTDYLPKIKLSEKIVAVNDVSEIVSCETLLLVVPTQTIRENCQLLKEASIDANVPLVICCKGVEQKTQKLMSEVVKEVLPNNPVAILSGPNFAIEVAKGLPACTTIACEDEKLGASLLLQLGSNVFRTYYTSDIIGSQIGGAVKNVLAIACGIAIGRGLGENASAAIVTRGMAEISRLCIAKGGRTETLMGLSGLGDIILTCGSRTSRNMSFGYELGKGTPVKELMTDYKKLAEGVTTSQSVSQLAKSLNVDMPICNAVNAIIFGGADIDMVINQLLNRPLTWE